MTDAPKKGRGFAPKEDLTGLFEDKLKSSGLSLEDAKKLGYSVMSSEETAKNHLWYWHPVPALRIPYYDPITGDPMKFLKDWPDIFRARWLVEPPPQIDKDGKKQKPPKYLQQRETGTAAYFPRIGDFSWKDTLDDWEAGIIITEGELKAAAACARGYPTIGLGGVDNYQSSRFGFEMIPSLERVTWARRKVIICFDSDISTKPAVCRALNRLAEKLMERGALPKLLILPQVGDAKVGLDDYLLDHTNEEFDNLLKEHSQFLTVINSLYAINDKWTFIRSATGVVHHATGDMYDLKNFEKLFTEKAERRSLNSKGEVVSDMVSAGAYWTEWRGRSETDDVTYDPTRMPLEKFTSDDDGRSYLNTWPGWGTKKNFLPVKGDVSPFLDLLKFLFQGATPGAMEWFIQWLGYPIYKPGAKLRTSSIIHSIGERMGKSSVGYTMKEIYGKNFQEIKQETLKSPFNGWQARRQFIMCDDITGGDSREMIDKIKSMISQPEVFVNEKYKPTYNLPDKSNFLWTTNRPTIFPLGEYDSRFFVHKIIDTKPWPDEKWEKYYHWLKEGGGAAALFNYFQNEVDYSTFKPHGDAFITEAKEDMKEASQSTISLFIRDLLRDGPEVTFSGVVGSNILNIEGRDLFTIDEILMAFQSRYGENERMTYKIVSKVLRETQCEKAHETPIVIDKVNGRYWIIRNHEKWNKLRGPEHYQAKKDHITSPVKKPTKNNVTSISTAKKRKY